MAPASARARRVSGCLAGIGSKEQIAKGTAQQVCDAAPGEMVRPVVNEMATLTQASQVLQPIVSGMALVGFRGDGAHHLTRAAIRAPSRAFPRRRALCTNSKKPR